MSKGSKGNKEAKKPKKAVVARPLVDAVAPMLGAQAPARPKKR